MKNLLLFFLPLLFSSQTHRFIYEFQYKSDSLATELQKENMVLDINPDEVKFYPYSYAELDSLNKVRTSKSFAWDDGLPAVIRKRNSNINMNYVLAGDFYVLQSKDEILWKLSNETKNVQNYTLQKATANFGGRNWTAWFNKEIRLNEGPYKFRGLPGLVFEVQDDRRNFVFNLLKSQKFDKTYDTSDFLESFAGRKPIPITQKIYEKKLLEQYNDPLKGMREGFKENPEVRYSFMGIRITRLEQFKELTEMAQKRVRQDNNPIEIDKAVKYPEK